MTNNEENSTLKSTFAHVMLLGGFIALTWAGAFALYLIRS
ncbi:cytochrome c oxidase subunit 2A [Paenibacillus antri]|uniref:Cytochrome c oxidase subunit 2A n=1 Tax=Paenibacillus antri TaxID=2582848 RepID=A0A5R9GCU5_9BACL|nr:cytochrome c oxidase subunit 2A [Paenibacillus antri]